MLFFIPYFLIIVLLNFDFFIANALIHCITFATYFDLVFRGSAEIFWLNVAEVM